MVPNLLEATNEYWRKLNQLEAAYRRGEVSLEEVDARVAELIAELGRERKAAIDFVLSQALQTWNQQREAIMGAGLLGALAYAWVIGS